jgi:hypothetical protein
MEKIPIFLFGFATFPSLSASSEVAVHKERASDVHGMARVPNAKAEQYVGADNLVTASRTVPDFAVFDERPSIAIHPCLPASGSAGGFLRSPRTRPWQPMKREESR